MQPGREVNTHRGLSYLVRSFPVDERSLDRAWFAHSQEGPSTRRTAKLEPTAGTTAYSNGIQDLGKQGQQNKLNSKKSFSICSQNYKARGIDLGQGS